MSPPPPSSDHWANVRADMIGFALVLLASLGICASLNIQKLVHVRNTDPATGEPMANFMTLPLWWVGCVLNALSELLNLAALGWAPATLVTPLGCLTVVFNAIAANVFLGEPWLQRDLLGIFLIFVGVMCVVWSQVGAPSPPITPEYLHEHMLCASTPGQPHGAQLHLLLAARFRRRGDARVHLLWRAARQVLPAHVLDLPRRVVAHRVLHRTLRARLRLLPPPPDAGQVGVLHARARLLLHVRGAPRAHRDRRRRAAAAERRAHVLQGVGGRPHLLLHVRARGRRGLGPRLWGAPHAVGSDALPRRRFLHQGRLRDLPPARRAHRRALRGARGGGGRRGATRPARRARRTTGGASGSGRRTAADVPAATAASVRAYARARSACTSRAAACPS